MEQLTKELTKLVEDYSDVQKHLEETAWFLHPRSSSLIFATSFRIYASNIGDEVVKIDCPSHYTKEQVIALLKAKECDNKDSEYLTSGTIL